MVCLIDGLEDFVGMVVGLGECLVGLGEGAMDLLECVWRVLWMVSRKHVYRCSTLCSSCIVEMSVDNQMLTDNRKGADPMNYK